LTVEAAEAPVADAVNPVPARSTIESVRQVVRCTVTLPYSAKRSM
jgi:hypothetical protein